MKTKSRHFITRDYRSSKIKIWDAMFGVPQLFVGRFEQQYLGENHGWQTEMDVEQWMSINGSCPAQGECLQISIEYL